MLKGVVYMLKRMGPRVQSLGVRHRKGDRKVMRNQRQEQRKSEMQYRTRMRDDEGELSGVWCQRQQKGREGRGRRLVDGLLLH